MKQAYKNFLIPGVQKFIEQKLDALGLTPEISIGDFLAVHRAGKHRYATLARNADGQKVIFYARLHKNEDARKKFASEVYYLRVLNNKTTLRKNVPACYRVSLEKNKEWFTREYITASPIGNQYRAALSLTQLDIRKLVKLFLDIQHIPKAPSLALQKRGAAFALPIMKGNLKKTHTRFSPSERINIEQSINSYATLLNSYATHTVHGDTHPGNVLLSSHVLHLIDWETVHINLRTADFAHLYVGLGKTPGLRRNFLHQFEKKINWKSAFRAYFPFSAMFYALNHLYTLPDVRNRKMKTPEKQRLLNFYVNIVKSSANGYTALRKV